MNTGQRIAYLREKRGLSQVAMAELLDTSPSAIGMWELGKRGLKDETLNMLANFFNVSTDYLLGIVVRLYPKTGNKKTPTDQMGVVSCCLVLLRCRPCTLTIVLVACGRAHLGYSGCRVVNKRCNLHVRENRITALSPTLLAIYLSLLYHCLRMKVFYFKNNWNN